MSQELKELVALSKNLQPQFNRLFEGFQRVEEETNQFKLRSEELYQFRMLYKAAEKARNIYYLLEQMTKPILFEGRLVKNSNGRYEVEGYELSSGSYLEVWIEKDWDDEYPGYYLNSRIEHNGNDYYIVDLGRDTPIEHMLVRIK